MYTFPELIKKIRTEAGLTQDEFAKALEVSSILITKIETGQKDVSKSLLLKIARVLDVSPRSITPFLFSENEDVTNKLSGIEKGLISLGEKMQEYLIKDRAQTLKRYGK